MLVEICFFKCSTKMFLKGVKNNPRPAFEYKLKKRFFCLILSQLNVQKNVKKCIFQPVFEVRSTQMLVKIYNTYV